MPEEIEPSRVRGVAQVGGGMSVGVAMGILTIFVMEQFGLEASAEVGVALGAVWTFVLNRLIRAAV